MKAFFKARKLWAYLALATVVLFIITGYGITQYRIVEMLSFGLLSKPLSFRIHSWLIVPLILFLLMHICCSRIRCWPRKDEKDRKRVEKGAEP